MTTLEGTLSAQGRSYALVVSRYNGIITRQLLDGALDCLRRHGADEKSVTVVYSPGSFEIPQVAKALARSGRFEAVICLGCVIRGSTPHFEFIASEVAKGVAQVALETGVPLTFGILTTDTLEQALERAGSKAGNKGWDAALSAIELSDVLQKVPGGTSK